MLSAEDNELLTNTNAGTPMGELFRRFWLPVALSSELSGPDCTPVRVKVLNEDLIAFRDTGGNVGLVDAYCPHRGAPMFFGRNEEYGLRCVYHGWKFDVNGACVELPNAPEGVTFRHKVKIKHYPTKEAGGMVWAYMGPPDKQPPFPHFEFASLPDSHIHVTKFILECNYLQAMEGDYDLSHGAFLHTTLATKDMIRPLAPDPLQTDPILPRDFLDQSTWGHLEDSPVGVWNIRAKELPDGTKFASARHMWMMPVFPTVGMGGPNQNAHNIRVPINNESICFYRLRWSYEPIPPAVRAEFEDGGYIFPPLIPGTFRTRANIHNDYEIDRVMQRQFNYTGISSFTLQDVAMMENQWGPLADRTKEHLVSSDQHIIYIRRRLLKAARAMAEGIEPSEPWHPEAFIDHAGSHPSRVLIKNGTLEEAIELAKKAALEKIRPGAMETEPEIPA